MPDRKVKVIILIAILLAVAILAGYFLRIDRFGSSQISWVDCVQINGIIYESNYERTQIDASLVVKQIGTVRFNVSDS